MNTDTPRTNPQIVLCNYGKERVCADFARGLERELIAFKRSNERLIRDHIDRLSELRFAENKLRQTEREIFDVKKQNALMSDALEFYATAENYWPKNFTKQNRPIMHDCGANARSAQLLVNYSNELAKE
jgi:hypothetical protein